MKSIKVKNILEADFSVYGRCADLLHPDTPYIGESPVQFYRDMLPQRTYANDCRKYTLTPEEQVRLDV